MMMMMMMCGARNGCWSRVQEEEECHVDQRFAGMEGVDGLRAGSLRVCSMRRVLRGDQLYEQCLHCIRCFVVQLDQLGVTHGSL